MNRCIRLAGGPATRPAMALALVLACLGGCANTHYATFVTKTSLSVVDVDTAPVEASIAFSRTEGYVGPRFDDGTVYPVTGFINATGSALMRETQQVFAGGAAATLVLGGQATAASGTACADNRENPPLFLATGTAVGLRVGFAEGGPLPNSFHFGYRRKELALVPVSKTCQPSVLATHDSDGGARTEAGQAKAQLGITQYFATGAAADQLAGSKTVKAMFSAGQQAAANAVAAFSDRERSQLQQTVDALECAAAVPDAQFDAVVNNASELALFPQGGAAMVMGAAAGPARRARYTQQLRLLNGSPGERGAALEIHRKRVCALAGMP